MVILATKATPSITTSRDAEYRKIMPGTVKAEFGPILLKKLHTWRWQNNLGLSDCFVFKDEGLKRNNEYSMDRFTLTHT